MALATTVSSVLLYGCADSDKKSVDMACIQVFDWQDFDSNRITDRKYSGGDGM
jgi:tRNA G37 N-methylase TrmD